MCKNSLLSRLLSLTNVIRVNLFYKHFYYSRLKSALPHRLCVCDGFQPFHLHCKFPVSSSTGVKVTLLYAFLLNEWQINSIRVIFKWKRNNKNSTSNPKERSNTGCPGFQWFLTKAMSHTDLSPCPFITTTNRLLFGYILVEWNGRIHLWLIYLYYVLTIHEY